MGGSGDFWKEEERKKESWIWGTDPLKNPPYEKPEPKEKKPCTCD